MILAVRPAFGLMDTQYVNICRIAAAADAPCGKDI